MCVYFLFANGCGKYLAKKTPVWLLYQTFFSFNFTYKIEAINNHNPIFNPNITLYLSSWHKMTFKNVI